ncbi:MAG: serine hydrolase domain-containing protein [Litoreibacter sp.]
MKYLVAFPFKNTQICGVSSLRPFCKTFAAILSSITFATISHAEVRCGHQRPSKQEVVRTTAHLETATFLNQIRDAFKDKYTGYAVIFTGAAGERLGFRREGWAIDPCDHTPSNFTLNTESAIGSVTKLFTTVAVLQTAGVSSLDKRFTLYLPNRWKNDAHAFYDNITLAMLLSHRGGFIKTGSSHISKRLRHGPERDAFEYFDDMRKYSNTGFGLFHYILADAGLRGASFLTLGSTQDIERRFSDASDNSYNTAKQDVTSAAYNHAIYSRIFKPLGISATCDANQPKFPASNTLRVPPNAPIEHFRTGNFARAYSGPSDNDGRFLQSSMRNCASGGLYMSAKDLQAFMTALSDPAFLSRTKVDTMINDGPADEVLGFDVTTVNGVRALFKNGGRGEGGNSSISLVIRYPSGAHAVFLANSAGDVDFVRRELIKAYKTAQID